MDKIWIIPALGDVKVAQHESKNTVRQNTSRLQVFLVAFLYTCLCTFFLHLFCLLPYLSSCLSTCLTSCLLFPPVPFLGDASDPPPFRTPLVWLW